MVSLTPFWNHEEAAGQGSHVVPPGVSLFGGRTPEERGRLKFRPLAGDTVSLRAPGSIKLKINLQARLHCIVKDGTLFLKTQTGNVPIHEPLFEYSHNGDFLQVSI